jgi:MSHA biogenesis protein MshQ
MALTRVLKLSLTATLLAGIFCTAAVAQSISQTFTQSTATGWTLSGSAILTVPSIDAAGSGWLRLTGAAGNEYGTAQYTAGTFTPIQTLVMQFDYVAWGGNGADGTTLYIYDATKSMSAADTGGGLGYCGGVAGYLAIGLDEYGNFSNPGDRCGSASGGPGAEANKLVIRGPYSANDIYITNTSVPGGVWVNTSTRPAANTVYVTLTPATVGYTLKVQFRQGSTGTTTTLLSGVSFPYAPPTSLSVGVSGSTGGSTNNHEVRNFTILATAMPDHFAISTPGTAVNCQPAPVTITALNSAQSPISTTVTMTLSTSTGHGDWALASGGGTLTPGPSNSGTATYTYVASDLGVVGLMLRDTYPETVTISAVSGAASAISGTALASQDLPLNFVASGFVVTNGSNVITTIGTRIAGLASNAGSTAQSLALQAVRTDTKTGGCTTAFASGTTANVSLAYQCNNPTSCVSGQSLTVTNNGVTTAIASNSASAVTSYTTVPLKFSTANAEAPFSLTYSDVGQITLYAKYNIPLASGAASVNTMLGSSQFVVQPASFLVSNIHCALYAAGSCNTGLGAPGTNPAAASATGPWFAQAGAPFAATVTAVNEAGVATPNFGQEISPAGVTLASNLVLPAGGNAPAIANPAAFGSFSAGAATGTSFSWPEVGVITLTGSVAGGSYLGTGNVTGTASANVGRFVPNNFAVALNTPLFSTGCAAGAFTYLGQPFGYSIAPVITVTAQALGGTTTQNYTGAFFRLSNASLTGRNYSATPASPSLNLSGLPSSSVDPAILSLGSGQGSLTFSAGTGITFTRTTPIAPFNADIGLSINVIDLDGVAAASNPVSFGGASGIGFTTSASQWYGRLAFRDAVGSELLDLPMPLSTQYYLGAAQGFTTNSADVCTSAPAIAFSNYRANLSSGETCVRDSGSPGVSGLGCAAPGAAGSRYLATAAGGGFNLILAAPGAGDSGALTTTATAPAWLQYPWNGASGVFSNPTGTASFGLYQGPPSRIYQREVY